MSMPSMPVVLAPAWAQIVGARSHRLIAPRSMRPAIPGQRTRNGTRTDSS